MNKKNLLVAGTIVLLIVLYQYLVLAPYQQQQREYDNWVREQNQATETVVSSSGVTKSSADNSIATVSGENAKEVQVLSHNERTLIKQISVGEHRALELLNGASIGKLNVENYFVRETEEKTPVVLNDKGLLWTSNNPQIQHCLNNLNSQALLEDPTTGRVSLRSQTPNGTCEMVLAPDSKHAGLLTMTLVLDGFQNDSSHVLRLQGKGYLGSKNQMDQNYLSYKLDSSINNIRGDDLAKTQYLNGRLGWMTWGDRYFSLIFKPVGLYNPNLRYSSVGSGLDQQVDFILEYPAQPELSKSRFEFTNSFYFGTRDTNILQAIDPELVETVELGFFASVARVMLWALKALNTFFNNFGVSIIALTVIVRILFWPLNKKAYMSTIKMKELQPEMDRIRKKYDPKDRAQAEQMNREIFGLYKNKKVNPLGGCLPMLLQLPIFIGLYGALNHSTDLYQAPFFGWLQDLSLPDPFYILPLVWTISLLGYIAINPQSMNTNQPGMPNMKWMMIIMNVFFGFLSKDWPAGLLVYLVVSNCVGLSQQFFLMRSNSKPQLIKEGV